MLIRRIKPFNSEIMNILTCRRIKTELQEIYILCDEESGMKPNLIASKNENVENQYINFVKKMKPRIDWDNK